MLQIVEEKLATQKRLVAAFFNNAWGGSVDIAHFKELASELKKALHEKSSTSTRVGNRTYQRMPLDSSLGSMGTPISG